MAQVLGFHHIKTVNFKNGCWCLRLALCISVVCIFGILPAADFLVVFSSVLQYIDGFQWTLFAVLALAANAWIYQPNSYISMQLLCCRSGNDLTPHLQRIHAFFHLNAWFGMSTNRNRWKERDKKGWKLQIGMLNETLYADQFASSSSNCTNVRMN